MNIFTHQIEGGGDDSSKLHEIWGQKEGNIGRAEGRKELLLDLDNGASYDSIAIVVCTDTQRNEELPIILCKLCIAIQPGRLPVASADVWRLVHLNSGPH